MLSCMLIFSLGNKNSPIIQKGITATINGKPTTFNINDTAFVNNIKYPNKNSYDLTIEALQNKKTTSPELIIHISGHTHPIIKGVYFNKDIPTFDDTRGYLFYTPNQSQNDVTYASPQTSDKISINITYMDKFSIQGTFNGKLKCLGFNKLFSNPVLIKGQFNIPVVYYNF